VLDLIKFEVEIENYQYWDDIESFASWFKFGIIDQKRSLIGSFIGRYLISGKEMLDGIG
jgi:hypothetical protein